MKVMTILGTRPEIIRLSLIISLLDQLAEKHILVHTGQNYDRALSDIFFEQMKIRTPDVTLQLHSHSFGSQVGQMFQEVEKLLFTYQPERVLLLGDTNSALCSIVAERMGIAVYHMEAGNRCYDLRVPEELNRKIIDTTSSFNLPYTPGSRENLLREGMNPQRIWVSGNPIREVLTYYESDIEQSQVLQEQHVTPNEYLLVTMHRAENVDYPSRLKELVQGLHLLAIEFGFPILCSVHPRTKQRLAEQNLSAPHPLIRFSPPYSFFDFVKLEKEAFLVLTDSGTVQEECCIFGVPTVTVRDTTERPETIVCGSNTLSGLSSQRMLSSSKLMISRRGEWKLPEGYGDLDVSQKVAQFLLGGQSYV